jgi:phosphatidylserine/phosphatidylglycerophosphate/cardiolipin synthase-like enzyme
MEVCFTPVQHCVPVVVRELAAATKSVRLQGYGFTAPAIEKALVDARDRGVDVQIILDRSNLHAKRSGLALVEHAGIPTSIDSSHPIAHAKIIIVDDETVLCGSYNWTGQAERNSEDLLVIHDVDLAARFTDNWKTHRAHAREAKP